MFEDFGPRKRDVVETSPFLSIQRAHSTLTLAEMLVVFSSGAQQTAVPLISDPLSISIRALVLCELVVQGSICIDKHGIPRTSQAYRLLDPLHDEVYTKIQSAKKEWQVGKWLQLLNGESYSLKKDKYHVKNARKRVGSALVAKKLLKKPAGLGKNLMHLLKNRTLVYVASVPEKGVRAEIAQEVSRYLLADSSYREADNLRMHALVVALSFCCLLEDVLLTLAPSASTAAKRNAESILQKYKSGIGSDKSPKEWSILCVLREYLKPAAWL